MARPDSPELSGAAIDNLSHMNADLGFQLVKAKGGASLCCCQVALGRGVCPALHLVDVGDTWFSQGVPSSVWAQEGSDAIMAVALAARRVLGG